MDTLVRRLRYPGGRKSRSAKRKLLAIQSAGGLVGSHFMILKHAFRIGKGMMWEDACFDFDFRESQGLCGDWRCVRGRHCTGHHICRYRADSETVITIEWINTGHLNSQLRKRGLQPIVMPVRQIVFYENDAITSVEGEQE